MKLTRLVAALSVTVLAAQASAQLRVVSYNMLDKPKTLGEPTLSEIRTVFGAIASDSVNGIAKRPDVLVLSEQTIASPGNLASILNTLYGVSTYTAVTPGTQTTSDRVAFVYDTAAVSVISQAIALPIASSYDRPTIRVGLRPVGYSSTAADFYVYGMHLAASDTEVDAAQRTNQVRELRADADTLPAGANIVYAGDMNFYRGSETAMQTFLRGGNGRANDPIDAVGEWHNNAEYAYLHTQATRLTTNPNGDGGVTGGVDDRFDFELVSDALMDGEGLSYIGPTAPGTASTHSYRAFGNGGNSFNQAINNAANRSKPQAVLNALFNLSDHLPVVADYQLPAAMAVATNGDALPTRVIRGASIAIEASVTNVANVAAAAGADELDYTAVLSGSSTGTQSGSIRATQAASARTFALDTSVTGERSATLAVTSSSLGAENSSSTQTYGYAVLAPSRPSLRGDAAQTAGTIDLGVVAIGSTLDATAAIYNLADDVAGAMYTAALDLDAGTLEGDAAFATTFTPISNVAADTAAAVGIRFAPVASGSATATLTVLTSDEDLPGAAARDTLAIAIEAIGAYAGDADLSASVGFDDLLVLAQNYGAESGATWFTGDFDRSGGVNFGDLLALAQNYGLGSTDVTPAAFAADWALAQSLAPEPSLILLALPLIGMGRRGRRIA